MFPAFGDISPPPRTTIAIVVAACLGLILIGATKFGVTLLIVFLVASLAQLVISKWSQR